MDVTQLEPKECFRWFAEIAKIPRGSGHEKAISDYLVAFAEERKLPVTRDAHDNVLITKSASGGMEDAPVVIVQGHMDMVWAKEDGYDFDFAREPVRLLVKGDAVTADRTTLGADNGIALAFILALLDADTVAHPALEAVLTTGEETGMTGASNFNIAALNGRYFINIDSEEEGVFCSSCAGGRRAQLLLPEETVKVSDLPGSDGFSWFTIRVSGLAGGHSGIEIHKERGNSNRLLGRTLSVLETQFGIYLADIKGGSATNVIPSESSAIIATSAGEKALAEVLDTLQAVFAHELKAADGAGLRLAVTVAPAIGTVMSRDVLRKVLAIATLMPDGVVAMDLSMRNQRLVEASNNFAMITRDEKCIVFSSTIRSSVSSKKEFIYDQIAALADLTGAEAGSSGDYPAWEYSAESKLRNVFRQAYASLFGEQAKIKGIHAGLECALFAEKFKKIHRDVDFIAFGPTITGAHSPQESLSRVSVEKTWKLLKEALASLRA